jgi:hypothetical protein
MCWKLQDFNIFCCTILKENNLKKLCILNYVFAFFVYIFIGKKTTTKTTFVIICYIFQNSGNIVWYFLKVYLMVPWFYMKNSFKIYIYRLYVWDRFYIQRINMRDTHRSFRSCTRSLNRVAHIYIEWHASQYPSVNLLCSWSWMHTERQVSSGTSCCTYFDCGIFRVQGLIHRFWLRIVPFT